MQERDGARPPRAPEEDVVLERLPERRLLRVEQTVLWRERDGGRVDDWLEEELARGEADGREQEGGDEQAGEGGVVRRIEGAQAGEVGGEVHGQPGRQAGEEGEDVGRRAESGGREADLAVVRERFGFGGSVGGVARAEEPDGERVCEEGCAEVDGEGEPGDLVEGAEEEGVWEVG